MELYPNGRHAYGALREEPRSHEEIWSQDRRPAGGMDEVRRKLNLPDFISTAFHRFSDKMNGEAVRQIGVPSGVSEKRRREFIAGRLCALRALDLAGCTSAGTLAPQNDRLPAWPKGWRGTISHTNDCAIAAVARTKRCLALGIDIEKVFSGETARSVRAEVMVPAEVALIRAIDDCQRTTLIFSAKESIYKALYPHVGRVFDFDAAKLKYFGINHMEFTLSEDWSHEFPQNLSIQVGYAINDGYVYTAVWLPFRSDSADSTDFGINDSECIPGML